MSGPRGSTSRFRKTVFKIFFFSFCLYCLCTSGVKRTGLTNLLNQRHKKKKKSPQMSLCQPPHWATTHFNSFCIHPLRQFIVPYWRIIKHPLCSILLHMHRKSLDISSFNSSKEYAPALSLWQLLHMWAQIPESQAGLRFLQEEELSASSTGNQLLVTF